jgi:Protein kinase domain
VDLLRPGDPRQIGEYLLSGRLGAGGMGEVFFGKSPGGRAVAVKLISTRYANDVDFRDRFRHEIEACRKVGGFFTAQVLEADPSADRPWMVSAYVAGPSLSKVLDAYGALPLHSLRVLGAGLAEALKAIHAAGIIHRDLKPSNILLVEDGPRVIDFGIAGAVDASRITAQHGTPGFMAPEVLERESVTEACDVFALGVVLAFAGGVKPFGEGSTRGIDYRVVHGDPDLQELDPHIRGLVAKCLARDPGTRPTPAAILQRLTEHDAAVPWLPEPIYDMIAACKLPREPNMVDAPTPDGSRMLAEAEQIARALPDEYERATALIHIATVACRVDPPHAARLLDDAWHLARSIPEMRDQSRRPLVEYLIESSPVEVGMAIAHSDLNLRGQMLGDIAKYSRLLTLRRMGVEEETATTIIRIAQAAASADPVGADQIARLLSDEGLQDEAVARVAMVVAYTDPGLAERMTRAIITRVEPVTRSIADDAGGDRSSRWRRRRRKQTRVARGVSSEGARLGGETARYWAAQALAEVALGAAGAGQIRLSRSRSDPEQFARTVTIVGDPSLLAPSSVRKGPGIDAARAKQYITEAEQLALGIAAAGFTASGIAMADLRAGAVAAVKTAAARVDSSRADTLLSEAEQAARAIGTKSDRFEALGRVALTAARIDPARAEQIARSLPSLPHKVGELALVVALRDAVRAERIAAGIADEWVRALVRAVLMVQANPGNAGPRLQEAEGAAHGIPARLIEVALVTARTDPFRAERIVRTIERGAEIVYVQLGDNQYERSAIAGEMRSAEYWRARALADLAVVQYERKRMDSRPA